MSILGGLVPFAGPWGIFFFLSFFFCFFLFWWLWLYFRRPSKLWAFATTYGASLFRPGLSSMVLGADPVSQSTRSLISRLSLPHHGDVRGAPVGLGHGAPGSTGPPGPCVGPSASLGLNPQSYALEAHPLTSPCPLLTIHRQRGAGGWGRRS